MDGQSATRDSGIIEKRPMKRQRSHSISGLFDNIYTFKSPENIHKLRPRTRSYLDELSISEVGRLCSLSEQASTSVPLTPLVSERMIRMQMLNDYLSQRGADLITTADVPSSRFFNLEFHHYLIDELRKISHATDKHWLYWYLHILFKYTGLKHIALSLLLVAYTFLGGFVFKSLEHSFERETTISRGSNVLAELSAFALKINQTSIISQAELATQITELYKRLRDVDGGLVSSLDRMDPGNATWTFETATFYAMTLLSTIGYGTIACKTALGKTITVVYVTVGLPLMLLVLRDLGFVLFVALQKAYNRFNQKRNAQTKKFAKEELVMTFPLPLAILLVYIYLMIMTLVVFFLDEEVGGGANGLSFGDSFYFAFISLYTIGLGDVMPNNIHDSIFFCGILLSGLALISIVNTATYARIEHKYFNVMNALDHVLLELEAEKRPKQDKQLEIKRVQSKRPVCHELVDIVRLAALVIPSLDNQLDDAVTKANIATDESRAKPLPALTESDNGFCRNRSGWESMRHSMRAKYKRFKTLTGGHGSSTADTEDLPSTSYTVHSC